MIQRANKLINSKTIPEISMSLCPRENEFGTVIKQEAFRVDPNIHESDCSTEYWRCSK